MVATSRRDWPGLLCLLTAERDDGQVYDRDLSAISVEIRALARRSGDGSARPTVPGELWSVDWSVDRSGDTRPSAPGCYTSGDAAVTLG